MLDFFVGQVVCGTTSGTRGVFGRVLEVGMRHDDFPEFVIIENFPTIDDSLQFIDGNDLTNLIEISGSGWAETKWRKIEGKWKKEHADT